jgi:hypothetical protein
MKKKIKVVKKYPEGTSSVSTKKKVSSTYEPLDTYSRESTTTYETKPGQKGKLFIQEGTIQRNPTSKGVTFKPAGTEEMSKTGKIVDPRSRALESTSQSTLRKATLDVHKDVNLENRYKEGDDITYQTKKGPQVAGRVQKTADIPAEYDTVKKREIQVSRKGDVKDSGGRAELAKQYRAEGYRPQPGTYKYIKDDENIFVPEDEVDAYVAKGYFRSDRAKQQLQKQATGKKKVKVYKKGSKKMC